jgi:hypothetical protein
MKRDAERRYQTSSARQWLTNVISRWRKPDNAFRTNWNVHNIPTLARYEKKNGTVEEVGRLTESEVLDEKRLQDLLKI